MSIEDVGRSLNAVLDALERVPLGAASARLREALETLNPIAWGSEDLQTVAAQWQSAAQDIHATQAQIDQVSQAVRAYMDHLGVAYTPPAAPAAPAPEPVRKDPPPVLGEDGSEYPPEAAELVPELGGRSVAGSPTVGKIRIAGRVIAGAFRSNDRADRWSTDAGDHIQRHGIRAAPFLKYHVEVRAAMMLREFGMQDAEVAINNVPCGYGKPFGGGCHALLPDLLPAGARLTVYGTDANGRPFRNTYEGKAP